ncbi:serine O-acetyltransferase [uncultured Pseudokineococcus sp.]|uniref:serine O-acetyltransferase n=1 Tax=uncultured Pseudokineococcus sp. TaxID=1642928 RepID=UPI00262A87CC|nr:hypothetical protein [uncultured Pseudokineococcus sp.]
MAPEDGSAGSRPADEEAEAADARPGWREVLREDVRAHRGELTSPGLHAVLVHRFGAALPRMPRSSQRAARVLHRLAYVFLRNVYGIEIPATVQLGRRVRIAHHTGVVIHRFAVIGDDCVLRHNVTLGARSDDPETYADQAPQLGAGVSLGTGAVVAGAVRIGAGARIAPNVTVLTDVPAGATVRASPNEVRQRPAPTT